jgi:hypothetical protein
MSFTNPGHKIPRRSVAGHEGEWVKSFDPPQESPPTPELLVPTNPVPKFIAETIPGAKMSIPNNQRVHLMHGRDLTMWDGKKLGFFLINFPDVPEAAEGTFPGPTIRIPR